MADGPREPFTRYDVAASLLHHWWIVAAAWVLYSVWMIRSIAPGLARHL